MPCTLWMARGVYIWAYSKWSMYTLALENGKQTEKSPDFSIVIVFVRVLVFLCRVHCALLKPQCRESEANGYLRIFHDVQWWCCTTVWLLLLFHIFLLCLAFGASLCVCDQWVTWSFVFVLHSEHVCVRFCSTFFFLSFFAVVSNGGSVTPSKHTHAAPHHIHEIQSITSFQILRSIWPVIRESALASHIRCTHFNSYGYAFSYACQTWTMYFR